MKSWKGPSFKYSFHCAILIFSCYIDPPHKRIIWRAKMKIEICNFSFPLYCSIFAVTSCWFWFFSWKLYFDVCIFGTGRSTFFQASIRWNLRQWSMVGHLQIWGPQQCIRWNLFAPSNIKQEGNVAFLSYSLIVLGQYLQFS